jgi:hypothetical protein
MIQALMGYWLVGMPLAHWFRVNWRLASSGSGAPST